MLLLSAPDLREVAGTVVPAAEMLFAVVVVVVAAEVVAVVEVVVVVEVQVMDLYVVGVVVHRETEALERAVSGAFATDVADVAAFASCCCPYGEVV